MTKLAIHLRGVGKAYGTTQALKQIHLEVPEGAIFALLGASGCGKTTTLRLIAGLEKPDSGEIWLGERPVAGGRTWVAPEERQLGMVFQDYALFPHLTVEANIAFALHRMPSVQRQNRIRELLVILGLEQYPKRYPHQLSGGQQQRVALARALAPRPGVVLLDEPFSNLDAALRKSTREEVHQILRHSATTTVFVTHDQEEALSMADWVGVMADGELKQVGTPRQLYDTPVSPEVALFVGQANRIEGIATGAQVQTILGVLPLRQPHTGPVEVFIRPENLKLSAEDGSPALVERDIYYGTHQTVWLRLEDGTRLKMNTNPQTVLRAEEQVRVVVRGSVVAFKSG